jgi:hypothetical protein
VYVVSRAETSKAEKDSVDKKLVRAMQLLKDERAQAQDKAQSAAEVRV